MSEFFEGGNLILLVTEGQIQNVRTLEKPYLQKSNWIRRKKEEKKKSCCNNGHYVLPATPKASTHTSLGPWDPWDRIINVDGQ